MFRVLGELCYRWRWVVIAVWVLGAAASVPFVLQVHKALKPGGFSNDQIESARARQMLERELGTGGARLVIIFQSDRLTADEPQYLAEVEGALANLRTARQVKEITSYTQSPRQVSRDRHTAYVGVTLHAESEASLKVLPEIEQLLQQPPSLRMVLTGGPVFYADIETVSQRDLHRAELIAFPFALAALLLVFGSVVAAVVTLLVGGLGVVTSLAGLFWLAQVADVSIFALNLTSMLGLGLGVDYSLFLVSRFREELEERPVGEAVAATMSTAGTAVFFSGVTVLLGLLGLMVFQIMMLRSVGLAGALVVSFSVAAALTLLPAVLGILGHRINALPVWRPRLIGRGTTARGFWERFAGAVMARRWPVLVLVLLFIVTLGLPFLRVRLNSPDATILPPDVKSRQGYDLLREAFGEGELAPIILAVKTRGPVLSQENVAALYDFTRELQSDPRVQRIDSVVTLDRRISKAQYQLLYLIPERIGDPFARGATAALVKGDTTLVSVVSHYALTSDEAQALVQWIRRLQPPNGMQVLVDGGAAEVHDVVSLLYSDFPKALGLILVSTYLVLLVLFRSVLLPLKAVVMNSLSIVASYGMLVWVFQEGNLSGLLRFKPLGFVEATLPIVMFCILFGLSMDYEVFLLTRVKEAYDQTGDNAKAVAIGLERSGRIITSAALIVIVVSVAFVAADVILIKALGLGVAVAVFLDATVIRSLLVPATMSVLGDLNWWAPAFLRRLLPEVSPHS